ncbi:MAG: helix-turn-helix domain-containing protein [Parasphingorhabdus sp.]|uniref:AraC family transcriptional regulator n=1 Tax=Parasphingorhabdus sp. TaxID=2709688 RepID=UPI00329A0D1B
MTASDLSAWQLRDPQAIFDSYRLTAMCNAAAGELQQDSIYAAIGSGMMPTGFSDSGYAALFEETVGDALCAFAMTMDLGVDTPMLRWQRTGSTCRLIWDRQHPAGYDLTAIIFALLIEASLVLTEGRASPIKAAYFQHRAPRHLLGNLVKANRPAKVPSYFNQSQTCLEVHPHLVDLPNPLRNAMVAGVNLDQLNRLNRGVRKSLSLTNLSYNYLFRLLDKSGLSLEAAAETFGMAERTLRRKLVAEGASFRQILEQVRKDACLLYFLECRRSLTDIAMKLGYSELSAFTRAYSAWHGRSPSRDLAVHIALAA